MQVAVQGERWFPSETTFSEELKDLWGDWYCDSEVGHLRAVLLHRPGKEIDNITEDNYYRFRFRGPIDAEKARQQHDVLAKTYRSFGIDVYYVKKQREDRPNALFVRDLLFMTPEGAIICRPGIPSRRGEERAVAATIAELGVPIIKTVNGSAYFEGASAMWVNRRTVIIGTGSRTNEAGAEMIKWELNNIGVDNVIITEIPYGNIHLDEYMNMVDKDKMLIFPWHVGYDCAMRVREQGVKLIELTDINEVRQGMSVNMVTVAPNKVVMPAGNPATRDLLIGEGVEVVELELDELLKGFGSVHCMTAFLKRDPI